MLFSFIVSCYNTADYIEKCIESIISQTYKDWEMILINDGSTDLTADILQKYAEKDARIKFFSQKNSGPSAARNRGIDKAIGDYLLFIDSDDWYRDENCLQRIAEKCKEKAAELVAFQFSKIVNGMIIRKQNNLEYFADETLAYTGEQYLEIVLSKKALYEWYPWLYAFNRKFWLDNKIRFDEHIYYYEDVNLIYKIILAAKKVFVLKEPIYQYYVGREGQLTYPYPSSKSVRSALTVCKNNIDTVTNLNLDDALKKLLNSNFSHTYFWTLIVVNYLNKSDQKDIFIFLKKNSYIMKSATNRKDLLLVKMIYIFGLRITAKLLFVRSKWKN